MEIEEASSSLLSEHKGSSVVSCTKRASKERGQHLCNISGNSIMLVLNHILFLYFYSRYIHALNEKAQL